MMAGAGDMPTVDIDQMLKTYGLLFHKFNLFSMLRAFPIGIFSLMAGIMPLNTPLGESTIWQVSTAENLLAILLGFTLAGWLGGGLFFYWVSAIVIPVKDDRIRSIQAVLQTAFISPGYACAIGCISSVCIEFGAGTGRALVSGFSFHVVGGAFVLLTTRHFHKKAECTGFHCE